MFGGRSGTDRVGLDQTDNGANHNGRVPQATLAVVADGVMAS